MSTDAYHEAVSRVLDLTPEEQLQLISVMEFEGFAKEIWEGVDVEKYINEERNSWDG